MKMINHLVKGIIVIKIICLSSDLSYAEDVERLIRSLKDSDWVKRSEAAEALGELRDKSAVPALIEALNDKDNDDDVKWNIVWALGELRDKSAVPALIEAMRQRGIQSEAMNSLRKIGEGAVPDLIVVLKDRDKVMRWNSASLLGDIGDQTAVSALTEALKNDKDEAVQDSIRKALERLLKSP